MSCSIIAAVATNRVIGVRGALPWHLPADLRHFKRLTTGHHLIVGRRTWESVGTALPNRTMIVVSRNPEYRVEGIAVVPTLSRALELASLDPEPFVGGGAGLYREALQRASTMYLTHIEAEFDGDTFFPEFDRDEWVACDEQAFEPDEKNPFPYVFRTYRRRDR